jgi:drug/metabolite transporter (DMT)-like permease
MKGGAFVGRQCAHAALVEVLFVQGVTRFIFKQPTTKRELGGVVLVVIGVALLVWAY